MKTCSLLKVALIGMLCSVTIPARADDSKSETTPTPPTNPMAMLDDKSILKKGDFLAVSIQEENRQPLVLQVLSTQPAAGDVQFPYIGLVKAEGTTPRKLAERCRVHLEKHYFKKATVIIKLVEPEEFNSGQKRKPPGGQN